MDLELLKLLERGEEVEQEEEVEEQEKQEKQENQEEEEFTHKLNFLLQNQTQTEAFSSKLSFTIFTGCTYMYMYVLFVPSLMLV